jgi:hypothetical protein
MEFRAPIRRRLAMALALAGLVSAPAIPFAQTASGQKAPAKPAAPAAAAPKPKPAGEAKPAAMAPPGKGTADRYTATAANLKGVAGETITIDLIRWSSDAERDKLVATFTKSAKDAGPALAAAPNIGYIWRSGSAFGSFVRYAYKFKGSDGEHVVLATDSDLTAWQGATKPAEGAYPFTVIEIVTPASGVASGKTSLGGKITTDTDNKTIRLDNYAGSQVALRGVRHMKGAA